MACILNNRKYLDAFLRHVQLYECNQELPISLQCLLQDEPQVLYNTEQLSRPMMLKKVLAMIQEDRCVQQWDYSQANLDILKHVCGPFFEKCHYKPLQSDPVLVDILRKRPRETRQDLGFVGTITPHRFEMLEKLKQAGIWVHCVSSFHTETQIQEMSRCKAILNLHAGPDQLVFESARCNVQLDAGIPVISETSLDDDPRCINVPRQNLVHSIQDWLKQNL